MYTVFGADGREYGPVDEARVRQWIAEGRVNASTRIRAGESIQRAGDIAALADALSEKTRQAGAPARPGLLGDPAATSGRAPGRGLDVAGCFSRAWALVWGNFWVTVGACALMAALLTGVNAVPLVGFVACLAFSYVLAGGVNWLFLKLARGQPAQFADMFAGFGAALVPLLLLSLVVQALLFVGFSLFVLPGLYVLLVYGLFPSLLILDKGLDFWPAMELSRKTVHAQFFPCAGLLLLGLALMTGGLALCLVGFFVALPVFTGAMVYAYEELFGAERPLEQPV